MRNFLVVIVFSVCAPFVIAQGTNWEQLSLSEQESLKNFQGTWNELSERNRQQLRNSASQVARMPQANQARVRENMLRIQRMTPGEQARIDEALRAYEQMSENEKQELKNEWESMTPAEQEESLLPLRGNGQPSPGSMGATPSDSRR